MKVIGQPENYSDILVRIFVCTLVTGVICTAALGLVLPEVKRLLDSAATDAELGPFKNLGAAYVAIPFAFALASRIVKLHDRVSNLLRLRVVIDTQWILTPYALHIGLLDESLSQALRIHRRQAMYRVFYPYVSLPDPAIDRQLVRSALDNLGWFWSAVEATVVILLTSGIFFAREAYRAGALTLLAGAGMAAVALALWYACRGTTSAEVSAILESPDRCDSIRNYLVGLVRPSGVTPGNAANAQLPGRDLSVATSGAGTALGSIDVFISHASEDKDAIARPLFHALSARGVSVWFDEATLELGDSLRRKIDEGLARCRYGVLIISPAFLSKRWPQRELDALVARETTSGEKAILPIWHNIEATTLLQYSPMLVDRLAASSREGVTAIVEKILRVLEKAG
jgi:hypothetical protein